MARLIVHNPPIAKLKTSGYKGEPTGSIELTENHKNYNVKEYAEAVSNIPDPVLLEKEITANGTYVASEDHADGYLSVDVNVQPKLMEKTVAKNGTYTAASDEVDGYSKVNVALPFDRQTATPSLIQQTVMPREGYEALERVTVEPTPLDSLTVIPSTQQQTITPQSPAIGFSQVTVEGYAPQPEIEPNFVTFIDYDGTILYSYTQAEVQTLTELPPFPNSDDYTYQEWNWSLESIKNSPMGALVGAVVTPKSDPESIELHVLFEQHDPLDFEIVPTLTKCTVVISWGDGESSTIMSSSAGGEDIPVSHTYQPTFFPARYKIKMKCIPSTSAGTVVLKSSWITKGIHKCRVQKLFVGEYFKLSNSSCLNFQALEMVAFSKNYTNAYTYSIFHTCRKLRFLILPKIFTGVGNVQFTNCTSLERVSFSDSLVSTYNQSSFNGAFIPSIILPHSMTSIGGSCFEGNVCLYSIYIPNSIMNVRARAFYGCTRLSAIDLSGYTNPDSIPALENTNVFTNIDTSAVFYVANAEMLAAFSAATNWDAYASKFQIKGD